MPLSMTCATISIMQFGRSMHRHARGIVIAALALLGVATGAGAHNTPLMPVYLDQLGPKAIQVEIAAGRVGPCDSSYNARLFHGWVEGGRRIRVMSPYGCVCYRHTYDDFPQVNWSPATVTCRRSCAVQGGYGFCPAHPDDALFIQIRSPAR
jgi:hypothetical protein